MRESFSSNVSLKNTIWLCKSSTEALDSFNFDSNSFITALSTTGATGGVTAAFPAVGEEPPVSAGVPKFLDTRSRRCSKANRFSLIALFALLMELCTLFPPSAIPFVDVGVPGVFGLRGLAVPSAFFGLPEAADLGDGVLDPAELREELFKGLTASVLTKHPQFSPHLKYSTPFTLPLFFPDGVLSSTPTHVTPGANSVSPINRTTP
mmetsp:Transcript_32602/g.51916  ORF Transcript_32602/g.51916 Transcript_32602/m.51916 type:complete len:207 (+) Transcript_32602:2820-3440(+)